jgi:hypothetical protein
MGNEYELCVEACKKAGCYCPPSSEFYRERANTPLWLRLSFYSEGYTDALDDNHIIHGKAAEKFIKDMNKKPTKGKKVFLKDCEEIYKQVEANSE